MGIGRVTIGDFVEIEEACRGDAFLAEGLETIERGVGHEPGCTEGDGTWGGGDFGGGILLYYEGC